MTVPRSHPRNGSVTNASNQVIFRQPARLEPVLPPLIKLDAPLPLVYLGSSYGSIDSDLHTPCLSVSDGKSTPAGSPCSCVVS